MKEMHFSVRISVPAEKVWNTMWQDESFRQWAGLIDPGTYMVGDLIEGSQVQFISAENGYGVTSLVEKLTVNEFLLLRHRADTQNTGTQARPNEWTGGAESYRLEEEDGTTTLTAVFDVPEQMEDYFNASYPTALQKIKELAEK